MLIWIIVAIIAMTVVMGIFTIRFFNTSYDNRLKGM